MSMAKTSKASTSLLFLLVLLLAPGCGLFGSSGPEIKGDYEIQTQVEGESVTIDLDLSTSDNSFSGTGTITVDDPDNPPVEVNLSGSHDSPEVLIRMKSPDVNTVTFEGETGGDADRIEGQLYYSGDPFSGFGEADVVLEKQ